MEAVSHVLDCYGCGHEATPEAPVIMIGFAYWCRSCGKRNSPKVRAWYKLWRDSPLLSGTIIALLRGPPEILEREMALHALANDE